MKLGKITKNLQPTLVKAGGAIVGSMAAKLIPFGNDKVKSGVVLLGGLLLSGSKGIVGQLGEGMAIGGALNLAKSFGIGGGDMIGTIDDARFIGAIDDLPAGGNIMGLVDYNANDSYAAA